MPRRVPPRRSRISRHAGLIGVLLGLLLVLAVYGIPAAHCAARGGSPQLHPRSRFYELRCHFGEP